MDDVMDVRERKISKTSPDVGAHLIEQDYCTVQNGENLDTIVILRSRAPMDRESATNQKQSRSSRKRYTVNKFPRIVKSDIRRKLPIMICNVINSNDFILLSSFLKTYCLPYCKLSDIIPARDKILPRETCQFDVEGVNSMAIYLYTQFELAPDLVMELRDMEIKQFLDCSDVSELIVNFNFRATKVYDIEPTSLISSDYYVISTLKSDSVVEGIKEEATSSQILNILEVEQLFTKFCTAGVTPYMISDDSPVLPSSSVPCISSELPFQRKTQSAKPYMLNFPGRLRLQLNNFKRVSSVAVEMASA